MTREDDVSILDLYVFALSLSSFFSSFLLLLSNFSFLSCFSLWLSLTSSIKMYGFVGLGGPQPTLGLGSLSRFFYLVIPNKKEIVINNV